MSTDEEVPDTPPASLKQQQKPLKSTSSTSVVNSDAAMKNLQMLEDAKRLGM
jgi:hypothetical protein